MDNTTGTWLNMKIRKQTRISGWNTSYPSISSTDVGVSGLIFVGDRPNGHRTKDAMYFLPRNGTRSDSTKIRFTELEPGEHRTESWPADWYPDISVFSNDNVYATAFRVIDSVNHTDVQKRLVNKMISTIMEGKGQLANDLLELSKTKRMVADAITALRKGIKDIRRGQPFNSFVRSLNKEGWNGLAGRRFLEFTYGWAPTVSGAFDVADSLARDFREGKRQMGYVNTFRPRGFFEARAGSGDSIDVSWDVKGVLIYEYKVHNAKLALLSNLGLTNPAAIVWEATPWSFVIDWAFKFGDYLGSLDWDLGISELFYQTSIQKTAKCVWRQHPWNANLKTGLGTLSIRQSMRSAPLTKATYTWKGVSNPFISSNADTRLAASLALLDQTRTRMKSVR